MIKVLNKALFPHISNLKHSGKKGSDKVPVGKISIFSKLIIKEI